MVNTLKQLVKMDNYGSRTVVIATPTKDIYDKLMLECDKNGIRWSDSLKASSFDAWSDNKQDTVIYFDSSAYTDTFVISYSRLDFFNRNFEGFVLYRLSEILNNNTNSIDLSDLL